MKELGYHTGRTDYFVAVRGSVYDLSNFWRAQHSDITALPVTDDGMLALAGQDLTNYFPIPLSTACPDLVSDDNLALTYATWSPSDTTAVHTSGSLQPVQGTALDDSNWYDSHFFPTMQPFRKGALVYTRSNVSDLGTATTNSKSIVIYEDGVYDLSVRRCRESQELC